MINLPTNRLLIPGLLAGMLILSACNASTMESKSGDGMMQEPMMGSMEESMEKKSMDDKMQGSMEKPMMGSMEESMEKKSMDNEMHDSMEKPMMESMDNKMKESMDQHMK